MRLVAADMVYTSSREARYHPRSRRHPTGELKGRGGGSGEVD